MYRCPTCRARGHFYVRKLGFHYVVNQGETFVSDKVDVTLGKNGMKANEFPNYTMTCKSCNSRHKVKEFMEAYAEPMKLFDTNNLCDCGGEVWQDVEYIKPETTDGEEFSGDQRKVAMKVRNVLRCDKCKKEKPVV